MLEPADKSVLKTDGRRPCGCKSRYHHQICSCSPTAEALVSGTRQYKFESCQEHHIGVSPSGKASDFDSVMRWFESSYPCHLCSCGGIGRRTRFRFWHRKACRFDSCHEHHQSRFLVKPLDSAEPDQFCQLF